MYDLATRTWIYCHWLGQEGDEILVDKETYLILREWKVNEVNEHVNEIIMSLTDEQLIKVQSIRVWNDSNCLLIIINSKSVFCG